MNRLRNLMILSLAVAICLFAAACSSSEGSAPNAASLPPPVSVIEASAQDVPIYSEYAAQTYARDMVEVRGRVDGYVEKRLFQVGADVKIGQPLYVLDLRPYQADV
ncbi:MAG TPA: efflux RND transporter periplasmic adaptor subunit, partial [Nitrospirales bacterium]